MMLAREFGCREDELVKKASDYINAMREVSLLILYIWIPQSIWKRVPHFHSIKEKNIWIRAKAFDNLCGASLSLYHRFFQQISQHPDGMKFLVDLRSDTLVSKSFDRIFFEYPIRKCPTRISYLGVRLEMSI